MILKSDILKLPYNKLTESDKQKIIKSYYSTKINFEELSNLLKISERGISRVLKEKGINTKRINRYTLDDDFFNIIDTEEKAYILGLLYADGFIGDEHFNNIVLGLVDRELVYTVSDKIKFTGAIRIGNKGGFKNSSNSYILNFSSKKMAEDLRKIGLYPNKSLTLAELPQIDGKLFRHFVRGYFDGDGSICSSKNSSYYRSNGTIKKYEYSTYMFNILGTKLFLERLVKNMPINHYKIKDTKTKEIKQLRVSAKCEFNILFYYLYDNSSIFLKRKKDKWLQIMSAFTE